MSNAIELSGVWYRAGPDFELTDVNMTVPAGSVYGFLGPNGSGKTTTMRLLVGLHKVDRGHISVLGNELPQDMPDILQRTGYVPEKSHLYHTLTVAEAVRYHGAFYKKWDESWTDELFDRFSLPPQQRLSKLSKGEMGKLLMLLALAQRPELLVLDEPTEGLDPVVRRELMGALLDYVAEQGATVLISSHLVHELERFCNWVGIMDQGRLVTELPMEQFKNGIKRLRITDPPSKYGDAPFELLMREPVNGGVPGEMLLVRGWRTEMADYFTGVGASLREVVDLDLEDGFVEMLRAFRAEMTGS
ncbi:MAG: ABC transporter ATP-binding protein [Gemmatimonadetes bacterium]|nr:ABC transporter ATP-binding protein [Gemmatimonadota bacterium]